MSRKPTLLILDYPGRRPEAHISDLGLEGIGFECRYLLTRPLPGEVSTGEYARSLAARSELTGHGALAVLSYCASAPLAVAVAAQLGTARPLPLVFLDPSQCHLHHIVDGYASVVRQIEAGEPEAGRRPLLDVAPRISRPALLIEQLTRDLTERAKASLAADGFDDLEVAEQLADTVGMYVQWLTFLLAVHHRIASVAMGEVLHVVSRHHPEDLGWLGTGDIRTARVGCERPDLARSPETRHLVGEFLDEVS